MLVTAEAGLGKTRLVRELRAEAEARQTRVLEGRCVAVGGEPLRHAALLELARSAAASGDDGGSSAGATTEELLERVLGIVERASAATPLLVVIEDVHWADRATCEVLMVLARHVSNRSATLVLTCRDDELPRGHHIRLFLTELERSQLVTVVPVPALSAADTARVIEHLVGYVEPSVAAAVYERADGNPLLIEELCAAGPLRHDGMPRRLTDVLLARADSLSERAQAAARAVAAGGGAVDEARLDEMMDGESTTGGLREALDHHLLVSDGERIRFRHVLVAEAVYAQLLRAERIALHARWAAVLSRHGEEPAVLAHHWLEAGERPRALAASVAAGHQAVAALVAYDALHHYQRALQLWDGVEDPAQVAGCAHVELCLRAAEAANWSGDPGAGVGAVDRALAGDRDEVHPTVRSVLLERKGWYLLRQGRTEPAQAAYAQAVDGLPADAPAAVQARVLAGSVRIWERTRQRTIAADTARRALALAISDEAVAEEGQARYMLGRSLLAVGDTASGLDELGAAAGAAERARDPIALTMALLDRADALAGEHRLGEALAEARAIVQRLRSEGRRDPDALLVAGVAGAIELRLGDIGAARVTAEGVVAEARSPVTLALGHLLTGMCELEARALDAAREHLELARFLSAPLLDGRISGNLALARGELALSEGRLAAAEDAIDEGLTRVERTGDDEVLGSLCLLGLHVASERATQVAGRQPTRAAEHGRARVARYERLLGAIDLRSRPAFAAIAAGWRAERSRLDGASDPELWADARVRWTAVQWPRRAVLASVRRAEALLARPEGREQGAVELGRAHEAAEAIGSGALTALATDVARRAGVVREPPAAGEASSPGVVAALTPRELDVVRLLATGATNRQIAAALYISAKTASVHVSRILTKLDATSREDAVAAVRRTSPSVLA